MLWAIYQLNIVLWAIYQLKFVVWAIYQLKFGYIPAKYCAMGYIPAKYCAMGVSISVSRCIIYHIARTFAWTNFHNFASRVINCNNFTVQILYCAFVIMGFIN